MPDVTVVAVLTAKPGSEAIVREALDALVAPTREEAGNRSYALYESTTTPGVFITLESWGDESDLQSHLATPHVAAALTTAGEHLAAEPAIHPLRPVNT